MQNYTINAKEVTVSYTYDRNRVSLSFDAERGEVAELLTPEDVIATFDADELLELIGEEKAKKYFGLVEADA